MLNIKMKLTTVKISELIPASYNPRSISKDALSGLTESIKRFGLLQPIIRNTVTGNIVGGHQRLKGLIALLNAGEIEDETEVLDVELSPSEERAANVTLNNPHIQGRFTDDLPMVLWDVLSEIGEDDYESLMLDELIPIPDLADPGGLTDDDSVPEIPIEPIAKTGDLYLLGNHRLLCGDSTKREDVERLMDGKKADMVFTDPPYGVGYDGGAKKRDKLKSDETSTSIYLDSLILLPDIVNDHAALYLWYADAHAAAAAAAAAAAGYIITAQIIWTKNNAQFVSTAHYHGKHEPCFYAHRKGKSNKWFGGKNEITVWEVDRSNRNDYHPTQKPVILSERAIGNSSEKLDIVLDLFGGSGSTLIACEKLNRSCYMMEIEPRYIDVIIKRWQEYTGQEAVKHGA